MREALRDAAECDDVGTLAGRLSFVASTPTMARLRARRARARAELGDGSRVLLYLSVPPSAMRADGRDARACGLDADARVVMEKPFGSDLESARRLNAAVHEHFDEEQVFRIDHFLGKEAAQDILALRFANGLFEPIWNRRHVAAVQIDVPETLGLEGRAAFYEETGALRDMVVTHLLPDPRLRGDGGAGRDGARATARREGRGVPRAAPARPGRRRLRAVRGLP